jgi:hypothetical protein
VTTTVPTRAAAKSVNLSQHCDTFHFSETDDRLNDDKAHYSRSIPSDNDTAEGECKRQTGMTSLVNSEAFDLVALAGAVDNQAGATEQQEGGGGHIILPCEHLDEPPTSITNVFSACLGDAYHAMSGPKVPVKHEFKKPYFVALQQAFFAWQPDLLSEVTQILEAKGFSKQDIKAKMYYDVDFFCQRVDRRILPPCQLYWRVRSVFSLFGVKVDSKSKVPLFNK